MEYMKKAALVAILYGFAYKATKSLHYSRNSYEYYEKQRQKRKYEASHINGKYNFFKALRSHITGY